MNFAYIADGTVTALNRAGTGEELTGFCTPQDLVWGMVGEYYTVSGGVLVPMTLEDVNTLKAQDTQRKILQSTLDSVDATTNQLIETGWIYPDANGQQVRLNELDQANYEGEKNLYAELDYDGVDVTPFFPLEIKVWTGPHGEPIMLPIENLGAYKTFIRVGKAHIKAKLKEGWLLKIDLITKGIDELKAWEDPR